MVGSANFISEKVEFLNTLVHMYYDHQVTIHLPDLVSLCISRQLDPGHQLLLLPPHLDLFNLMTKPQFRCNLAATPLAFIVHYIYEDG